MQTSIVLYVTQFAVELLVGRFDLMVFNVAVRLPRCFPADERVDSNFESTANSYRCNEKSQKSFEKRGETRRKL